jgi:hypothetical protein
MPNISYTEDPKRMRQAVRLLKILATDPHMTLEEASRQSRITADTVKRRLFDFCILYQKTVDRPDFPNDIVTFYNRFCQNAEESLSKEEVLKLKTLTKIFPGRL